MEEEDRHEKEAMEDLSLFDRAAANKEDAKFGINKSVSLTNKTTREYLQSVSLARDNSNQGMPRKEMITFIMNLHDATMKQAENHYDHLI